MKKIFSILLVFSIFASLSFANVGEDYFDRLARNFTGAKIGYSLGGFGNGPFVSAEISGGVGYVYWAYDINIHKIKKNIPYSAVSPQFYTMENIFSTGWNIDCINEENHQLYFFMEVNGGWSEALKNIKYEQFNEEYKIKTGVGGCSIGMQANWYHFALSIKFRALFGDFKDAYYKYCYDVWGLQPTDVFQLGTSLGLSFTF